jgi:hypothetical protein
MLSSSYNYISSFFYTNESEVEVKDSSVDNDFVKVGFISIKDLKSVQLQPVKDVIPNPARNAPPCFTKVDLRNLNRAQLNSIMSVKLKPTPKVEKKRIYEVRHPCLRELLTKRNIIH